MKWKKIESDYFEQLEKLEGEILEVRGKIVTKQGNLFTITNLPTPS